MLPGICAAQEERVPFRARFWHADGIFSGTLGGRILDEGSFVIDSNGEISMMVSRQDVVRMTLSDPDWRILYPREGMVPVPRDSETFAQVIIARADQAPQAGRILTELERLQSGSKQQGENVRAEISALRDSLAILFTQQTLEAVESQLAIYEQIRSENDRRDSLQTDQKETRLREGKLKTTGLLSSAMDHYITRTEDLRDIVKFSGKKTFHNSWAVDDLNQKVAAYNEAYEGLNARKNEILDQAEVYWEGDYAVVGRVRNLLEFALDDVHKMTNLSANSLLSDIANYRDPRVKRRNKRDKREIQSDMDRLVYDLSLRLSTLIDRKSEVFQLMER